MLLLKLLNVLQDYTHLKWHYIYSYITTEKCNVLEYFRVTINDDFMSSCVCQLYCPDGV